VGCGPLCRGVNRPGVSGLTGAVHPAGRYLAEPGRVTRMRFSAPIGSPPGAGGWWLTFGHGTSPGVINNELPAEKDEVPLPNWSLFGQEDLDDELQAAFRERAIRTLVHCHGLAAAVGERRCDAPVTVIACEFSTAMLREWMEHGEAALRQLGCVFAETGRVPACSRCRSMVHGSE
jgi:hypothetical protein